MQASNGLSKSAQIRHLQQQWHKDRSLRRRVPASQQWRGCLGLALFLENPDATESHGDLALVRNEQLTWLALRDVTAGDDVVGQHCHPQTASIASSAIAQLRYGMPRLNFTEVCRDSVNMNFMPRRVTGSRLLGQRHYRKSVGDILDAENIRWFATLNRLSAAMTRFAFCATDAADKPWRPAWAQHRPRRESCFVSLASAKWMPRPYLGFDLHNVDQLRDAVLNSKRQLSPAFYDGFCRSLAEGLVLRTAEPEIYCGKVSAGPEAGLHQLRSMIDQTSRFVQLPRGSRVLCPKNRTLEPAEPWARVHPQAIHGQQLECRYSELAVCWSKLRKACGGAARLNELMGLWFDHEIIRLPSQPGMVLVPADLVANVAAVVPPMELWWDTAPMLPHYDWEIQAAVLPPVPMRRWNDLQMTLSGEVAVNAKIGDPRWDRQPSRRDRNPRTEHHKRINSNSDFESVAWMRQPHSSERPLAIAG